MVFIESMREQSNISDYLLSRLKSLLLTILESVEKCENVRARVRLNPSGHHTQDDIRTL